MKVHIGDRVKTTSDYCHLAYAGGGSPIQNGVVCQTRTLYGHESAVVDDGKHERFILNNYLTAIK